MIKRDGKCAQKEQRDLWRTRDGGRYNKIRSDFFVILEEESQW